MLSEEGMCEVYLNFGPGNMCHIYKVYPKIYNVVDVILENSLSVSCIEVCYLGKIPLNLIYNLKI